ncbi:MAG: von Willebrand factor type A domain-containing protein, partial [Opitutaceae bacterium]|nr:von Willebrand factor type A domain-containing protein [Opitutaceae bacterium]
MLSPDDPRLTAFALGELEGDERAWIAAAVAQRPELQSAVDDIRHAADELAAALAAEPLPEVEPVAFLAGVNGHGPHHEAAIRDTVVAFPGPRATPAAIQPPRNGARHPAAAAAASTYTERSAAARRRREPSLSYFWVMTLSAACFMLVVFVSERKYAAEEEAAAAAAAQAAATERARLAAAAARRTFLELDLRDATYALARFATPTRNQDQAEAAYLPAERRPNSSFPIDVATTSYGDVVRAIAAKQLPPAGAVRIEEMLNTFAYDYPEPAADDDA